MAVGSRSGCAGAALRVASKFLFLLGDKAALCSFLFTFCLTARDFFLAAIVDFVQSVITNDLSYVWGYDYLAI
jgi:hypothetical protein